MNSANGCRYGVHGDMEHMDSDVAHGQALHSDIDIAHGDVDVPGIYPSPKSVQ